MHDIAWLFMPKEGAGMTNLSVGLPASLAIYLRVLGDFQGNTSKKERFNGSNCSMLESATMVTIMTIVTD